MCVPNPCGHNSKYMLCPKQIPSFTVESAFSNRYAIQTDDYFSRKKKYVGNILSIFYCCLIYCIVGYRLNKELNTFLTNTIMIRRLKADVQSELPPKMRSKIPVECTSRKMIEIKEHMRKIGIQSVERFGRLHV